MSPEKAINHARFVPNEYYLQSQLDLLRKQEEDAAVQAMQIKVDESYRQSRRLKAFKLSNYRKQVKPAERRAAKIAEAKFLAETDLHSSRFGEIDDGSSFRDDYNSLWTLYGSFMKFGERDFDKLFTSLHRLVGNTKTIRKRLSEQQIGFLKAGNPTTSQEIWYWMRKRKRLRQERMKTYFESLT
jgi:hypothetical protein